MKTLETMLDSWKTRPTWFDGVAIAAGLLLGAAAILCGCSYPVQYLGTVTVLVTGVSLTRLVREKMDWDHNQRPRIWGILLSEGWAPTLLAIATLVVYSPLLRGAMPLTGDHQVHEYNAYVMGSRMLSSGRLMGWTTLAGAGYPAGHLYPILGSLWIALVHFLGLGHISWDASYAYGLLAVLLFISLSIYWVGRRLFGPIAGLLAGLAVLTDMGGFRQGGWIFTIQFGVWPLALSMAFGFLFVERVARLALHPNLKDTIWASLWLALGLLAHPMMLLFALLAIPLAVLYGMTTGAGPLVWLSIPGTGVLGAALAGLWLVPFLLDAPRYSIHVSDLWKSLPQIGQGLVTANLYQNTDPWILVLGVTGLVWMTIEGRPKGRLAALVAAVLLAVSSITIYAASGIERILPSIRHVQFERFVMFLKVFVALGAGFLVQRILVGIPKEGDGGPTPPFRPPNPSAHPTWAGLLAAAAIAPLITPVLTGWISTRLAPLTTMETTQDKPRWRRALRHLLDRAKNRAQADPRGFFRVAYWSQFNDHKLAAGPVLSHLPQVKCSFIPAETYRYRAHAQPGDVPTTKMDFHVLAVRFLVADRPPPAAARNWTLLGKEAGVTLYENPDYRWSLATLSAPGKVEVLRFEDEHITLRISGLAQPAKLVLHVPRYPNWRARQNGRLLSISQTDDLAPHVKGLMSVTVHNGLVEFDFRQTAGDILGKASSLLALLVLVFLSLVALGSPKVLPLWTRITRLKRPALWTVWVLAGLILATVLVKWAFLPDLSSRGRSLTWDLSRARVWLEGPSGNKPCRWFLDGRYICGKKAHQYVGPIAEEWGLKNHRGLWAHPYRDAKLIIEYPSVTMGRRMVIDHGILKTGTGGKAKVHLRILVGETPLEEITHRTVGWRITSLDTSRWRGKKQRIRFEIWTNDISARHFAFDATIQP